MSNRYGRDAVVADLPDEIGDNIPRNETNKLDVHNILDTCLRYEAGLESLIGTIEFYEGRSIAMKQLANFVRTLIYILASMYEVDIEFDI